MSSTYEIICLSHDPALAASGEWSSSAEALAAIAEGIAEHPSCELVVGRYSSPLVSVCCPRQKPDDPNRPLHHGYHPHSDDWVDANWLRLAVLAGPEMSKAARLPGCWDYERARRLRLELGVGS